MVRKVGYILTIFLLSTFMLKGQDSMFVFHVSYETEYFYASYSNNEKEIKDLTFLIEKNIDKLLNGEMALAISGKEIAAASVQSYFVIYEGLKAESFVYTGEETLTESDKDMVVEVTLYRTGFEPESVVRVRRKKISTLNQVSMKEVKQLHVDREEVRAWRDEFVQTHKPVFTVKTNLLIDAALTPNIAFDIPLAKHWSIAAEYYYGWWLKKDNSFCWQINSGGIELKYWFDRSSEKYNVMDKWYAGVFYNLGIYDFQFNPSNGVQGNFNLFTGLSGGYVLSVGKHLSFTFSLSAGFLSTTYQNYYTLDNVIVKRGSAIRMNTIFPKAEVSLAYIVYQQVRKGGAR